MAHYNCTDCNYKFKRDVKPKQCPYCGSATVCEYAPTLAQDLLDVTPAAKPD